MSIFFFRFDFSETLEKKYLSLKRTRDFINRQTENFKVLLVTSTLNNSIRSLTRGNSNGAAVGGIQYIQPYLAALGANSQQLGYLNSLTSFANVALALPIGWISDRVSLKRVVQIGFFISCIASICFASLGFIFYPAMGSSTWTVALPFMVLDGVATTLVGIFATVFYINSVNNSKDRATAMSLRYELMYICFLFLPAVSSLVVLTFGGGVIGVNGIRPMFLIALAVNICSLIISLKLKDVAFQKKEPKADQQNQVSTLETPEKKKGLIQDYGEIFSQSNVRKWCLTKAFRTFFATGLLPFFSIYYVTVKGADTVTIGLMSTICTIGSLIFLIPFGHWADRIGRKKIILITRPFNYLSIIISVFAPSTIFLLIAAFIGSLQTVSMLMEITMEPELVPPEQRGREGGLLFFMTGATGAIGALVAGYLYPIVNQQLLLCLPILADIPWIIALITIPDTLNKIYTRTSQPQKTPQ